MTRIPANPERLIWARECAGLTSLALAGKQHSGASILREGP